MATPLLHPEREVIDCFFVIFTTRFGRHLTSGKPLDITAKGKLVRLNAEPVVETRTAHFQNLPVEVLVPMVTVASVDHPDELYVVVYDENFVVCGENHQKLNSLVTIAQQRPNTYDPLTRQ